ncbi:GntR family transcriptional regulator [Paeniglutamicibacter antarcticus]|uniref:GntR family transcriptional regulator n=1 Tax=Arthrobacter terrae TaxID=2935737 RepID=A0A931CKM9_9MICC|nr:GntR family transcriptional regulator [Arthrobacter terrae]MBG0737885.1 GntR family transcriptional regulator [Arthrobacter terrae]
MTARIDKPRTVNRQVLADHVYQEVLASLMDGRLMAGAGISIDGLARELDVSPTPVREALARLEATGMVRRVALKGYSVAPLFSAEDLAQLMDARLVIEPVNAFRACERRTPALNQALAQAITDLRTAPRGVSFAEFREYWEADERFHRLIAESSGNQFILSAYNSLGGQVQRFRFFSGLGVTDAECAIEEHTAIFDAFTAGDPKQAQRAMVAHISGVKQRAVKDVADHA